MSTPSSLPSDPAQADTILFRPTKKRKIYRQRAAADDEVEAAPPAASFANPAAAQSLDELITSASTAAANAGVEEAENVSTVSMAEILRLRKKLKARGGVEFKASGHVARDGEGELVPREDEEKVEGAASSRVLRTFAPQTGTVGDVNRHMMAYIDSEIAKRRAVHARSPEPGAAASSAASMASERAKGEMPEAHRQAATIGKLQEIDLGDEARDRNIERTNNARRRLDGEMVEEGASEAGKQKRKKVRLNRDGSVWVPRRHRRGSDDIKRDQLVEAVLRENRLDIYEEPAPEPASINDDQAADDRIAEAFRREFLDAVSQKQRKKPAPAQSTSRGPGGKKEDEPKGPKLGGSRSARAAMREAMLAAKK